MDNKCEWLSDEQETCTNGDCPACADFCPCTQYPEICMYSSGNEFLLQLKKILVQSILRMHAKLMASDDSDQDDEEDRREQSQNLQAEDQSGAQPAG